MTIFVFSGVSAIPIQPPQLPTNFLRDLSYVFFSVTLLQIVLLFPVMSHLMSPLFLLLRNLTQFHHPTLIFFQSLMSCRSPLDNVFRLVFLQAQVPLAMAPLR
jgi:hypothetical protein